MVDAQLARKTVPAVAGVASATPRNGAFKLFEPLADPRDTFEAIISQAPNIRRGNGGEQNLRKAYDLVQRICENHKRKDGLTPEIFHPLGVLFYAAVLLRGSATSAARALLHDSGEDGPKRGLPVNYDYLRSEVGGQIAKGVAYITVPKCVRPRPDPKEGETTHIWIHATHNMFNVTPDHYRGRGQSYPPEVFREMRKIYFTSLLTKDGITIFPIKICDAISNLSDIQNLPGENRIRKLEEDRVLINIAARMDWALYELISYFLKRNDIEVPNFNAEIRAQHEKGVVVCRPRDQLDFRMASEELPIQHPNSVVLTVYMDPQSVHDKGQLEIGLPRIGNGHKMSRLEALCRGQKFNVGRSLFHGYFDFGAKDTIYVVNGLNGRTRRQTKRKVDNFLDNLRELQKELAEERQLPLFIDSDLESAATGTDGE